MVTYNVETGRIKYLDNKAYRSEASVGKVSATEKNLAQNMADDIVEIEKYAAKKGVPPEIKNEVLPDMKAAQQELAEYIARNKPENLYDPQVQKDFNSILKAHDIDRVVTTSGGGKNVTVTKGLGDKGFKQE
jgi:ssDNA-specific exonuclease RecJ